jgi:hypothetical protein
VGVFSGLSAANSLSFLISHAAIAIYSINIPEPYGLISYLCACVSENLSLPVIYLYQYTGRS